jgi:L-erythro-3,5-diaminohexanoate dehydrogenase
MAQPRPVHAISFAGASGPWPEAWAKGIPASPFGCHRSLDPPGGLPQPARTLDNDFARLYTGEMLVAVETLNIDAASFRQMEEGAKEKGGAAASAAVAERVLETVKRRGKQHNPVTGSGGMLLGRVLELAPGRTADTAVPGDRIATLVSLSLTPLRIDRIRDVRGVSAQVDVEGEAILFASGAYAKMPKDMPERLALAVLDVAGAAPQVARLVRRVSISKRPEREPSQSRPTVLVLGAGGKSGILCVAEARRSGGDAVRILGVENHPAYAHDLRDLGLCDDVLVADARNPLEVREKVLVANAGREVDLALSCVNVPDAEMSAILCTRDGGIAYFFAMSTSFAAAALGAEGVSKDVELVIGNGFAVGHAEHTLEMMRSAHRVRGLFERRYG